MKRLSPRERASVRRLAASGTESGVYWKVSGRTPRGRPLESETWFLIVEP